VCAGGGCDRFDRFDRKEELLARLRRAPGEEARQEVAAGPEGPAPSGWTLRTIRVTFPWLHDYSLSGVWRVLNGCDLGLRSGEVQRYSPDPEYAAKEAQLDTCLREAARRPEEVVVLFIDEMGYFRWPDPAVDWAPTAPAPVPRVAVAGTNQQWRVIGGLNALTGRVHYRDNSIVGREQIVRFYDQLDPAYPAARRIYLVEDNWSVPRHPEVLAALRARPRLEVVWLPT
jgi:hypothetical protein